MFYRKILLFYVIMISIEKNSMCFPIVVILIKPLAFDNFLSVSLICASAFNRLLKSDTVLNY